MARPRRGERKAAGDGGDEAATVATAPLPRSRIPAAAWSVLVGAAALGLVAVDAVAPAWIVGGAVAVCALGHHAIVRRTLRHAESLEAARRDADDRHRTFRRSAGIGMFEWNLSRPYIHGTPEYFAMMGMPRDKGTFTKEEWERHVHPEDRPRALEAVQALIEEGRPYNIEFRTLHPDGKARWYANRAVLFRTREGKPAHVLGAMLDIDALKRSEARVRERERMFRRMADDAPVMIWLSDATGRVTFLSRSFYRYTGQDPEVAGTDTWMDVVHPDDQAAVRGVWAHANETQHAFSVDVRARRRDGVYRWMLNTATPRFEEEHFVGFIGSVVDIADRKQAEERHALLMREVDHRAKNVLALVISVLRVTRAETREAYVAAVEGRVEAMARAHILLAESRWSGAPLRRLVTDELGGHLARTGAGRVEIEGPDVTILADAVQPMTIVLHELVTNATKHGALSRPEEGRLRIAWWRPPEGNLTLEWREDAGRPVTAPSRHGFGRVLMETLMRRQVGGDIVFQWEKTGLVCRMTLPAALVTLCAPAEPEEAVAAAAVAPLPESGGLAGRRVLVVEDDVLVALGIAQILTDLKYEVLGPVHSVEEALALLGRRRPDAALVDINLGGVLSTQVARRLSRMGVRFAYCTGYGDSADQEEPAPMLMKPVSAGQVSKMVAALLQPPAQRRNPGSDASRRVHGF